MCMIVRDEEQRLPACLESVRKIVGEVVIVDTGSSDHTVRIALGYGARVASAPWKNDFALARNRALAMATNPWILCLDADERIAPEQGGYLRALTSRTDVHGYTVQIKSFIGDAPGGESMTDEACRLFRNDPRIRFDRPIHEQALPSILALPDARVLRSRLLVLHEGYLNPVLREKNKTARNTAIIREALRKSPDDPEIRYAYAVELYQQQRYEDALGYLLPLLGERQEGQRHRDWALPMADMTLKAAYALKQLGRANEAWSLLEQIQAREPDHPELLDFAAGERIERRQPTQALMMLNRASKPIDHSPSSRALSGSGTYRSAHLAGMAHELLRNYGDAASNYAAALMHRPDYAPAWSRLSLLAAVLGQEQPLMGLLAARSAFIPPRQWMTLLQESLFAPDHGLAERLWELAPDAVRSRHAVIWSAIALARQDADLAQRELAHAHDLPERQWVDWGLGAKSMSAEPNAVIAPPDFAGTLTEPVYRRCQDVLLQMRAWEALAIWMETIAPASSSPQAPVHRLYACLDAPSRFIRTLLQCAQPTSLPASVEASLGALAAHAGLYKEGMAWLERANRMDAAPPDTAAALALTHSLLAQHILPPRMANTIRHIDRDDARLLYRSLTIPLF
ncbi:tetratricopeptide repeat protein [Paenibacillus methanolicus]|uniref:Tetratricopeptide repeat protein n=2 Tax=Paenibacillus methanolicus TaxID=582686 RepID=A0A5S5CEA0_9BACL|nr:tetratricopeptide repeat protein [Paenibacillus methanolicus]